MAEIASAFVTIAPSAKGFGRSLDAQVSGETRAAGQSIGRTFGKMFVLGASVIAAAGIGNLLKGSIAEAREANKIGATTEQVIKSTGGAANLTATQVGNLSSALSDKIGVDDEAIQAGANLLLTFKNVRDEVGEGADIFTRATAAGADLAATGFGSIESNAKTLGKALNDPTKGMTALTRAGVTFTQKQQDRIKGMVAEGDLLGAQKLLLGEVESQVGGVAEATATSSDKAQVAWGNLKEDIGQRLLPVVDRLAEAFVEFAPKVMPAIDAVGRAFGRVKDALAPFVQQAKDFFQGSGGTAMKNVLSDLAGFIVEKVVPALRDYLTKYLQGAKEAFGTLRDAVKRNEPELRQILQAFKKVAEFIITKVMPVVGKLAGENLKVLGKAIGGVIDAIGFLVRVFNKGKEAFDAIRDKAQAAREKFADFRSGVSTAVRKVKEAISTWLGRALAPIQAVIDKVQALIDKFQAAINKFNELRSRTSGGVKGSYPPATGSSGGGGKEPDPRLQGRDMGRLLGEGVARGIASTAGKVSEATQNLIDKLKSKLDTLKSDFASLKDSVAGAFTGDLFEAETAGGFISNLMSTQGQLTALKAAFTKLVGWGLKPEFLSQLFQSGNGGLILDLAAGSKEQAQQANNLFGSVTSLSNQLGTAVADEKLGDRIKDVKDEIRELRGDVKRMARDIGIEVGGAVSGAARNGHRRGRAYA